MNDTKPQPFAHLRNQADRYFDGRMVRFAKPQTPEAFPVQFTQRVFVRPDFCDPDELSTETIELMHRRIAERLREQFQEFSRVLFLGARTEADELCDALDAWLADSELENPR